MRIDNMICLIVYAQKPRAHYSQLRKNCEEAGCRSTDFLVGKALGVAVRDALLAFEKPGHSANFGQANGSILRTGKACGFGNRDRNPAIYTRNRGRPARAHGVEEIGHFRQITFDVALHEEVQGRIAIN